MHYAAYVLKHPVGRAAMLLCGVGLVLSIFTSYPLANIGLVLLFLGFALMLLAYISHKRITGQNFTKNDTYVSIGITFCLAMILVVIIATIERMVAS